MVILAALIHLPKMVILIIGLAIVAGHNLLDNFHVAGNGFMAFLWAELHKPKLFILGNHQIRTGYPVLPWIAVMALGYCFGSFYQKGVPASRRKKILVAIGSSAIVLFIMIRGINVYGDPNPWMMQSSIKFTLLSFLNVNKYPPSLLYILITLGPAILFLPFAEKLTGKIFKPVIIIGRVPLFFYLLHLYLIHLGAMLAAQLSGFHWSSMVLDTWVWMEPRLTGYGFSLGFTYLVWIIIVVALYPLCKKYDQYKTNHKEKWWLSYL